MPIPCDSPGNFIQSDLYYASLYHHTGVYPQLVAGAFDNWDKNGNGLYNESSLSWPYKPAQEPPTYNPDGVDGYPDLAIGRVPAGTEQNVIDYVNKIKTYETTIALHTQPDTQLAFTLVTDAKYDPDGTRTNGLAIKSGLSTASFARINYLRYNGGSSAPLNGYTDVTAPQLAAQAGQSTWVSYIGHGWYGQWDNFTDSHVQGTQSLRGLPVVFAAACKSGSFTPHAALGFQRRQ